MPPRTRTIKVSDDEYQRIVRARTELAKRGYQCLPVPPEESSEDFALGAIVALGAVALVYLLSQAGKDNSGV